MGRKAFCCCSLRVGVIFIGALSIAMALVGLAVLCVAANGLTAALLSRGARPAALHPVAPTPDPDAEFVRVPRHSPAPRPGTRALDHTIEHYTRLILQNLDTVSSRLMAEEDSKATNQDSSETNNHQSETVKKNDTINGSQESNSNDRRQVEESTREVETDSRSSQKDRFAETSTEAQQEGKQPGGDENSANSFDSPPRTSKAPNTQSSTEMTSQRDPLNVSTENAFVGSPRRHIDGESTGRELEEEEGNPNDKNWKDTESPICGGPELEEMMFKISFLSAYEAVEQSREASWRALGAAALGAGLYAWGLAALWCASVVQVLHFGAGVLLIVAATKGKGELLQPWRLLALATWAMSIGGNVALLAAFHPIRSRDPTKMMEDSVLVAVLVIYIAVYAYCYSVVLNFERELHKKKQKERQETNASQQKDESNIYSSRF